MRELTTRMILSLSLGTALACLPSASAQGNLGQGHDPDVAYHETTDKYLAVFLDDYSFEGDAVYGQLVNPNGTRSGGRFHILPGTFFFYYADLPRVASVRGNSSDFAVVGLGGRSEVYPLFNTVSVTGGAPSQSTPIAGLTGFYLSVDVGGEITTVDSDVIVVAQNRTAIEAYEVDADTHKVLRRTELATGAGLATFDSPVAISSNGGLPGRYLVTWYRNDDVWGAIVDRDLQVLVSEFPIAQTAALETRAEVDGDGTGWIVAYERRAPGVDSDIVCRGVTFDPRDSTAYVSPAVPVEADAGQEETHPTVRWTSESYIIGFSEQVAQERSLVAKSIEFLGCRPCEGEFPIATTLAPQPYLRVAAGAGGEGGLMVWQQADDIRTGRFTTDDGDVVDLGGGCGQGGTARATCAAVGAPAFGMSAQHAAPAASGWLVLGANQVNFACGPCTLVPDPVAVLPVTTDARGNAEVSLQLGNNPSLRGRFFTVQWLFVAPGGCSLGLSMSNAIQVTIE